MSPVEVHRRTALFKATGEAVWNDEVIRELLLRLSFGKCAYCECGLTTEGKYLEVDHFACKDIYPDEVVHWHNLLPSCKRCNTTKGAHDVKKEPIVNPFDHHPSTHFSLSLYRLQPKTEQARLTAAVVGLNHHKRAVTIRFEIGEQIQQSVAAAFDRLSLFVDSATTLRRRKLLEAVEGLLHECAPSVPYAATAATVLHRGSEYPNLKAELETHGLWNDALQALHDESSAVCL